MRNNWCCLGVGGESWSSYMVVVWVIYNDHVAPRLTASCTQIDVRRWPRWRSGAGGGPGEGGGQVNGTQVNSGSGLVCRPRSAWVNTTG